MKLYCKAVFKSLGFGWIWHNLMNALTCIVQERRVLNV